MSTFKKVLVFIVAISVVVVFVNPYVMYLFEVLEHYMEFEAVDYTSSNKSRIDQIMFSGIHDLIRAFGFMALIAIDLFALFLVILGGNYLLNFNPHEGI